MKKIFKPIFKSLLILLSAGLCLLIAASIYVYYYQDKIIKKAFEVVAAKLPYPIQVQKIELSFFEHFPQLSLLFHEVIIQDTLPKPVPLLVAQKISCTLNLLTAIQGHYIIEQLSITQAKAIIPSTSLLPTKQPSTTSQLTANHEQLQLQLPIDLKSIALQQYAPEQLSSTQAQAVMPSTSLLPTRQPSTTSQLTANHEQLQLQLPIDLKSIALHQVELYYTGTIADKPCMFQLVAQQVQADIQHTPGKISLQLDGQVVLAQASYQSISYQSKQPISLLTHLSYDTAKHLGTLHTGHIKQNDTSLALQGSWKQGARKPHIELQITADQLGLANLLGLMPQNYQTRLQPLALQGYAQVTAKLQQEEACSLTAHFKLHKASLLPQNFKSRIHIEELTGQLSLPHLPTTTGVLTLEQGVATLGNSRLTGSMTVDLKTWQLKHQGNVSLDLPTLSQAVASTTPDKELTGQLIGSWQFDSRPFPHNNATTYVELVTKNVQFKTGSARCQIQDAMQLTLKDHVLSFPALDGYIDGKKFTLAGHISNLKPFALTENQPAFQAKLYVEQLNIDSLLPATPQSKAEPPSVLAALGLLRGTLTCDIAEISYKHFQGKSLRGKVNLDTKTIHTEDLACRFAGGKVLVKGTTTLKSNHVHCTTQIALQDVSLPDLFAAFDNFNQPFLEAKNLGGRISSDMQLSLQTDSQFHIDLHSIRADATIQLEDGVLKDFEPLQKLGTYTAEKKLSLLRFSNLKNNIHIEQKVISIPHMEVHTNLVSIEMSGTHSFDGKINYSLVIPLQYADKDNIDASGGINPMALAGLNLYLRLEGDVHHYTLRFDSELLQANLQKNLKNQAHILQKLWEGSGEKKPIKTLSKDDYLDLG